MSFERIDSNADRLTVFTNAFFSILTILDSVFDYCIGCLIYYELVYPFYKRRGLVD